MNVQLRRRNSIKASGLKGLAMKSEVIAVTKGIIFIFNLRMSSAVFVLYRRSTNSPRESKGTIETRRAMCPDAY